MTIDELYTRPTQAKPTRPPSERRYIYGLIDDRTPDEIKYVGQTKSPRLRLQNHRDVKVYCHNRRLQKWKESVGAHLDMVVLEETNTECVDKRETHWIREMRATVLNICDNSPDSKSWLAARRSAKQQPKAKKQKKKKSAKDRNGSFMSLRSAETKRRKSLTKEQKRRARPDSRPVETKPLSPRQQAALNEARRRGWASLQRDNP